MLVCTWICSALSCAVGHDHDQFGRYDKGDFEEDGSVGVVVDSGVAGDEVGGK